MTAENLVDVLQEAVLSIENNMCTVMSLVEKRQMFGSKSMVAVKSLNLLQKARICLPVGLEV